MNPTFPAAPPPRRRRRSKRTLRLIATSLACAGLTVFAPGGSAAPSSSRAGETADLSLSISAAPNPVVVGQPLTYTLTVVNNGPDKATSVDLDDAVPPRLVRLDTTTATQGTCTISASKYSMRCRLGILLTGASVQITVVATPLRGGVVLNEGSVAGSQVDPNTANQAVRLQTNVTESTPPANVQVGGDLVGQPFQAANVFIVKWSAVDPESGVASYDVRYRSAAFGQDFQDYVAWKTTATAKSSSFAGDLGTTYCFSTRATDKLGNVSDWSAEQCTAIPLDISSFRRTGAWATTRKAGYYGGRYLLSSLKGAGVSVSGVTARRLALVASVCPNCGTIEVFWRGRAIRRIPLSSALQRKVQLIPIVTFSQVQTGTLLVKVFSLGRRVKLEGLAASRV